jgi:hypothetical protein
MRRKIIGIFVVGILIITGFASIPIQAGPVQQPLTSPDPQIIDMIQQVNESLLYDYLTHLTAFGPRFTGTENCTKASQYIYDEFQSMGLSVEFHNWSFDEFTDRNVVATLQGTDTSSNATFIICAAHDTGPTSPGANDDGSGVAAVLASAKILSQHSFNYTICFITFSGEEQGLYGSYMYASDASYRGDNIVAFINLDMIGLANTTEDGRTLNYYYPQRTIWLGVFITTVSSLYKNQTNITGETIQTTSSVPFDSQSFIDYGFDAVTAQEYAWDNDIHTPLDTSNRINWTYLTKATKLSLAVVAELASTPIELQVIITKPYQGYYYFFNNPLRPLTFKNYRIGFRGTTFILGFLGYTNMNVRVIPNTDIVTMLFCIDGNVKDTQYGDAPQYNWTIDDPLNWYLIGRHSVGVYVYTPSGKVASDEMNIIVYNIYIPGI